MLYFSETMLFSVQSSSAKEFNFDFCINMQSSVLFWSQLMTCSLHVSLLFDLSIKLLSELMILSSVLMNFRFAVDFGLREREKFQFSTFNLQRSHLWSYWVEWELVLIVRLYSITWQLIWYIICFDRSLSLLSRFFLTQLKFSCLRSKLLKSEQWEISLVLNCESAAREKTISR